VGAGVMVGMGDAGGTQTALLARSWLLRRGQRGWVIRAADAAAMMGTVGTRVQWRRFAKILLSSVVAAAVSDAGHAVTDRCCNGIDGELPGEGLLLMHRRRRGLCLDGDEELELGWRGWPAADVLIVVERC
jgi:hypothetical protein